MDKSSKTSVQEGSLIAEVALWTPWIYLGDLISKEMSRVVAIDVESFCACVAEMHEVQEQVRSAHVMRPSLRRFIWPSNSELLLASQSFAKLQRYFR